MTLRVFNEDTSAEVSQLKSHPPNKSPLCSYQKQVIVKKKNKLVPNHETSGNERATRFPTGMMMMMMMILLVVVAMVGFRAMDLQKGSSTLQEVPKNGNAMMMDSVVQESSSHDHHHNNNHNNSHPQHRRREDIFKALYNLRDSIKGTVYLPSDEQHFDQASRVWCEGALTMATTNTGTSTSTSSISFTTGIPSPLLEVTQPNQTGTTSTTSTTTTYTHKATIPWAVIEVQDEADVQITVPVLAQLQRDFKFPFRIRSGGHHKAGFSTVSEGAVISLVRLNAVSLLIDAEINNDNTDPGENTALIRMGPAVLVNQFLREILLPYGYAGVIGFCGTVAEGGFVLGGGIGLQSRLYGLGLDNVVGMRVVLSNGTVVYATNSHNSNTISNNLFWALRGAGGGSFGVVTQMDYRIHKAMNRCLFVSVTFPQYEDIATFLYRLGETEPTLKGNLMVMHDVVHTVNLMWSGRDASDFDLGKPYIQNLLRELVPPTVPTSIRETDMAWTDFQKVADTTWSPRIWKASCWYGFLLPANNTADIWHAILQTIYRGIEASPYLVPDIELWGGKIHDANKWNQTAFPYRSAVYNVGVLLQITLDTPNADSVYHDSVAKVNAWWPKVAQYLSGSYVNYPMKSLLLDKQEYARVYWGDNLPRLVDIKQQVDPHNVFQFPMSVPISRR